jgi:hypothetical protein
MNIKHFLAAICDQSVVIFMKNSGWTRALVLSINSSQCLYDMNGNGNPIERCHAIANLGLQSVGMMRESIDAYSEKVIKNLNSTVRVQTSLSCHFKKVGIPFFSPIADSFYIVWR